MKKIIQVLSTVLILALLTSCGYNYSKEYDKLYEASNSGTSFSNLKGQYETFKSKLVEKYEELARKSRDLTEKEEEEYHTVRDLLSSLEDNVDARLYAIARNLPQNERAEAASWLYEWTSWSGPTVTVYLADDKILNERFRVGADTINLSSLSAELNERGLIFRELSSRNRRGVTVSDLSNVPVVNPFSMDFDVKADASIAFNTAGYGGLSNFERIIGYEDTFTVPALEESDDAFFVGWSTSEGDYISGTWSTTRHFMPRESILHPEDEISPHMLSEGNVVLNALYTKLEAGTPYLYDPGYTEGHNANPGETIRLFPVIRNTGTLALSFDIVLGDIDENTAKYAEISSVGNFFSIDQDVGYINELPLYPGEAIIWADYGETEKEVDGRSFEVRPERMEAYINIKISPDTPIGTVLEVPINAYDVDGNVHKIIYPITVEKSDFAVSLRNRKISDAAGNGDGKINPGETIYMDVVLGSNAAVDTGYGTKTTLSCDSDYVTIDKSVMTHSYIAPGEYANATYCNYSKYDRAVKEMNVKSSNKNNFSFTVHPDCPEDEKLHFTLTTIDNLGNESVNRFTIIPEITDAEIQFSRYAFKETSGDKDGTLNPGEKASADLLFYNAGTSGITNLTIELYCEDDAVVLSPSSTWKTAAISDNGNSYKGLRAVYKELGSGQYANSRYYNTSNETYEKSEQAFNISLSKDYDVSKPVELKWRAFGNGNIKGWSGVIRIPVCAVRSRLVPYGYRVFEYDGNGDGIISPTESFGFRSAVLNAGEASTAPLSFRVVSDSQYITIENGGPYDIDKGVRAGYSLSSTGVQYKPDELVFSKNPKITLKIAANAPLGMHQVNVIFTDGINIWEIPYSLEVAAPDTKVSLAGYAFIDSLNGDGKLNIGESAYLDIRLYNAGSARAEDVKATLILEEGRAIITNAKFEFGDIPAGNYKTIRSGKNAYTNIDKARLGTSDTVSSSYLSLRLPNDVAEGSMIKLKLVVEDRYSNRWEYPIIMTAEKAELGIDADISIRNKPSYEYIYPGETIPFLITAKNTSRSMLSGVTCTISSDSQYAEKSVVFNYGDLGTGKSKQLVGTNQYGMPVSHYAPVGEDITYSFVFRDASGTEKVFSKTYRVGRNSFDPELERYMISGLSLDGTSEILPGGYVYIDALLRNVGPVKAEGASVVFSTDNSDVVINTPEITFGSIPSGYYATIGNSSVSYQDRDDAAGYMKNGTGAELRLSEDIEQGDSVTVVMKVFDDGKEYLEKVITFRVL